MLVSEIEIHYKSKVKPSERTKVTQSRDSYNVFKSIFDVNKIEHKEMFYAMYLNRANKILGVLLISEGGLSGTVVDPKLVFQGALKLNASALILSHNHPSGNLQPSHTDIEMTKKIKECGKIMEVSILDHLIITPDDNSYFSFADEGLI